MKNRPRLRGTVMTMSAVGIETVVDRELPSVVESVPYARDLVAWSVPPALRHDVALVVSELVANAVKHGSGPIGLVSCRHLRTSMLPVSMSAFRDKTDIRNSIANVR